MATMQGVNLSIKGVDTQNFRFVSLQLTESVGAFIPQLVATFIAGSTNYNLDLKEVELTLSYLNHSEITFTANIDQIDFGKNNVIMYMTAAPIDFYQINKSATFFSLDEAIMKLYKGGELIQGIHDMSLIEFNQVNQTDADCLFRALSSLKSPSCFSFGLGRLKVTDLSYPKPDVIIREEDRTNYKIEDTDSSIHNGRLKRLPYYNVPVMSVDGLNRTTMSSWGNSSLNINTNMIDMLNNIMDNSKFYDRGNHMIRVIFKYLPDFMCGDIITINLQDVEARDFLVVERLALMKEDVEVSVLLKPL